MTRMTQNQILKIKELYPKGRKIKLINMNDIYAPVPPGTTGTVSYVDDMGTIHVNWENGSTLGVIPGEDSFI